MVWTSKARASETLDNYEATNPGALTETSVDHTLRFGPGGTADLNELIELLVLPAWGRFVIRTTVPRAVPRLTRWRLSSPGGVVGYGSRMSTSVEKVHFAKPPVRSVALTVFFEPMPQLQVSHMSTLREQWREEYPNSAELPPLRPRNREGDESIMLPITSAWPTPYVMMSSLDDHDAIAYQSDRFIRSWKFADDGADYPGFENLADDLERRFGQFRSAVAAEVGQEPKISGSSCGYLNDMPNLTPAALLVGLATKWAGVAPSALSQLDEVGYAGMHVHFDDDGVDGCSVNLTMDWDEEGATLSVDSSYDLGPDDDHSLGGLQMAHDRLIEKFLEYTSPEMHQTWERTS